VNIRCPQPELPSALLEDDALGERLLQLSRDLGGVVRAGIVDDDDLIVEAAVCGQRAGTGQGQLGRGLGAYFLVKLSFRSQTMMGRFLRSL
jgi:hypothetical protein